MHHHLNSHAFGISVFLSVEWTWNLQIVALNEGSLNAMHFVIVDCIQIMSALRILVMPVSVWVAISHTLCMYKILCVISGDAGGQGSMPYQSLKEQKVLIRATGLPDGLCLKKPSRYGRHQLEKILEAAEQLSFQISKWSWDLLLLFSFFLFLQHPSTPTVYTVFIIVLIRYCFIVCLFLCLVKIGSTLLWSKMFAISL